MSWLLNEHLDADFLYLPREDVVRRCAGIDVVGAVEEALAAHAKGRSSDW